MAEIIQLNSNNNRKIEDILETYLVMHDNATSIDDEIKYKIVLDAIYSSEMKKAKISTRNIDNSIGFKYFLNKYKDKEKCLEFFTNKCLEQLLYYNNYEDFEDIIHDNFNSYEEFSSSKPNCFIIKEISKYDEDLSNYLKFNITHIESINTYYYLIRYNWDKYKIPDEQKIYKRLINRLEKIYEENDNCSFSEFDSLVYIFLKNNMIDKFKKYYIMEDISDEEYNLLIENNNVSENITSFEDIRLFSSMDELVKKTIKNNNKRLFY